MDADRSPTGHLVAFERAQGATGEGNSRRDGTEAGEGMCVADPGLLARWTEVQIETIREAQRLQDLAWQEARVAHAGLRRVIGVRHRRNIRLVFPFAREGMFLVPPLWAVTEGEILVGFAVIEEL